MDIHLKYGTLSFQFSLPEHTLIPEFREPEFAVNRDTFTSEVSALLIKNNANLSRIAIVVSDKTRLCGYPEYLPWLTGLLMEKGAKKENITFYIAYGTHARQSEEESLNSYGDIYRQFSFVHHDCNDISLFDQLGITSSGTPVFVRKDILNSTLLITFGSISHHYFAGYGGGRKLIFPGLAQKSAVYHNHGLFLDKQNKSLAPGCQPGVLTGNPLAEDLKDIDWFSPFKISIHGILNASGRVCRLIAGDSYGDFVEACNVHDSFYRFGGTDQYDLVIASSGGYPKDINFIQAHKSVHHASAFVKDGGMLIMLSECIDQIGSNYFMKYLAAGSFEAAFSMLEHNYEGNGGTALSMILKTKRIRISMVTALDEGSCKTLGVSKIGAEEVQNIIDKENGTIAVIRNASMLVK